MGDGDEVVAGVVLQHPQQTHHRHASLRLSPLCVIDDSPEDDDEHGKAVTPDVEFPGRGTDSLKLTDYIAWDTKTLAVRYSPGAEILKGVGSVLRFAGL